MSINEDVVRLFVKDFKILLREHFLILPFICTYELVHIRCTNGQVCGVDFEPILLLLSSEAKATYGNSNQLQR